MPQERVGQYLEEHAAGRNFSVKTIQDALQKVTAPRDSYPGDLCNSVLIAFEKALVESWVR